MLLFIASFIITFTIGFTVMTIVQKIKAKRIEKMFTDEFIRQEALREIGQGPFIALCTTVGTEKAWEMIITNYKITRGLKL